MEMRKLENELRRKLVDGDGKGKAVVEERSMREERKNLKCVKFALAADIISALN